MGGVRLTSEAEVRLAHGLFVRNVGGGPRGDNAASGEDVAVVGEPQRLSSLLLDQQHTHRPDPAPAPVARLPLPRPLEVPA